MARSFIASTNQASFGDTSDFDGATSCTWAGWFSFLDVSGTDKRVWAKWGAAIGGGASTFIINKNTGGKIGLAVTDGLLLYRETTAACVGPGRWAHLIFEWTGGTGINIYAGGISLPTTLLSSNNSIGGLQNSTAVETFGKDSNSSAGATFFADLCGAWRNVTLTQGEKAELAAGADPATIRPAALIALPTFERSGAIWDRKRGIVAARTVTREAETGAPRRATTPSSR